MGQEVFPLEEYKKILLRVLGVFIDFCEEYKLSWYACGGTAIGAVRHQGFIPWDDDIDVYMPREDYDRFLSLKNKLADSPYKDYEIIDPNTEKEYYLSFAKFSDKNTTLWEYKVHHSIMGVYIDVFPLDTIEQGCSKFVDLANRYKLLRDEKARALTHYILSDYIDCFKSKGFKHMLGLLWDGIYHRRKLSYYEEEIAKIEREIFASQGKDYYCYGLELYMAKECFPKVWFDGYVEMPFEHLQVRMPKEYDLYLKSQFGDYMQLPPEESRISHHAHYYVNLERRLSLEEVRKIMKR